MVQAQNLTLAFSSESSIQEELKRESTADVITILVSILLLMEAFHSTRKFIWIKCPGSSILKFILIHAGELSCNVCLYIHHIGRETSVIFHFCFFKGIIILNSCFYPFVCPMVYAIS